MEFEKKRDKEEILEKGKEIGRLWRVGIDENLTMEERKRRWRMVEVAKRETSRRKKMEANNRKLRVEGRRWTWNEKRKSWEEAEEEEER